MKRLFTIYFLTILPSSSLGQQTHGEVPYTTQTAANSNSEEKQPAKTVIDFLKWYRDNRDGLIKIQLVNNEDNAGKEIFDTTKFYSVNFDSTEKYLSEFKKTGFVSDKYLDKWRQYFKKCDADLKKSPQNDGPPEGFDYDFVMLSQEFNEQLSNLDKVKIISAKIDNDKATMELGFYSWDRHTYWLTKQNNNWKIDDIK